KRLQELTAVFLHEMQLHQKNFNVHRIIIALIGDLLESFTIHGKESALSCEFSNPEQIKEAIECLFFDVILPIANTGVQIDIPAVTGNHDREDSQYTLNYPGKNNFTWVIYNALDLPIKQSKL